MKLHDLRPAEGATHSPKRVGRGHGSGWGKTSTRGNNGQGQRSGEATKAGFEGGQKPLFRRLPKKKHFRMPNRSEWAVINLHDLEGFEANTVVSAEFLKQAGVVKKTKDGVRILGGGELAVPMTFRVHHVSASAREKIEKAGGTVEILGGEPAATEA